MTEKVYPNTNKSINEKCQPGSPRITQIAVIVKIVAVAKVGSGIPSIFQW
jgi:hypothetical protein